MSTVDQWLYWISVFMVGFSLSTAAYQFRKQKQYGVMWLTYAVLFGLLVVTSVVDV